MEFADENAQPFLSNASFIEAFVKIALTPFCASSKLPRIAATPTFAPSWVAICSFCILLTPSQG